MKKVIKTLLDLVRELNALNDDNLAERVIKDGDVQWCLLELQDILEAGQSALRPVSREQVERIRGEWVAKHRHRGGFRRVTGVDDMGEQRTITIDERCEYDDRYCSRCGKQSPDNFLNFCGYCGAPMTDEAVQMVMERLEALRGETETD